MEAKPESHKVSTDSVVNNLTFRSTMSHLTLYYPKLYIRILPFHAFIVSGQDSFPQLELVSDSSGW